MIGSNACWYRLCVGLAAGWLALAAAAQVPSLAEQLATQPWPPVPIDPAAPSLRAEDEDLLSELEVEEQAAPPGESLPCRGCSGLLLVERDGPRRILRRLDPVSQRLWTLIVLTGHELLAATTTASGTWVLTATGLVEGSQNGLVLLPDLGRPRAMPLPLNRFQAELLGLGDGSLLVVGGRSDSPQGPRSNSVQRFAWQRGQLVAELLPDFPGPARWGTSLVALADGGALLLGGSTDRFLSCRESTCSRESWRLDPGSRSWSPGPLLLQPRAQALALRLPDGAVLVAGGWEQDALGNLAESREVEVWPGSGDFRKAHPLAVPATGQDATLLSGLPPHTDALIADRDSWMVQAYHPRFARWRVVGEIGDFHTRSDGPWTLDGQTWLLASIGANGWRRVPLSIGSAAQARGDELPAGVAFFRDDVAFLPAGGSAAVVVGGRVLSRHGQRATAGVDRLGTDGRHTRLPSLATARSGGYVFRLPDGALVVAGGTADGRVRASPEWLRSDRPDAPDDWQPLRAPVDAYYGQAADGALLALTRDGQVSRIRVGAGPAGPESEIEALPALPERRVGECGDLPRPVGLADGRILILGGHTAVARIAVLDAAESAAEAELAAEEERAAWNAGLDEPACFPDEDGSDAPPDCGSNGARTGEPEVPDIAAGGGEWPHAGKSLPREGDLPRAASGDWPERYGDYGLAAPSRHYLILEPGADAWKRSARSSLAGTADGMQVLPDGRVLRVGLPSAPAREPLAPVVVEISDRAGENWQRLPDLPFSVLGVAIRVVDGEIFAYGRLAAKGPSAVFHHDTRTATWRVVRRSDQHPPTTRRAFRLFAVDLPDGRRVLLPETPLEPR